MKTSKSNPFRRSAAAAAVALAVGAVAGPVAFAGTTTVQFESNPSTTKRKLGSFTGSAAYDDVTGLLTVTVNNTSAANKGGYLTGLAFNIAGDGTVARYLDGDDASTRRIDEDAFDNARARRGIINGKPLGRYDGGAAVNGKFGNASRRAAAGGIAAGESRTFVFDVDNATSGMTAASFFSGTNGIAAAFRGRKADRVGGIVTPGSASGPVVTDPVDNTPPIIDLPDDNTPPPVIPPGGVGGTPGGNGGDGGTGGVDPGPGGDNGGPAAVPLPAAAWPGLAGLALAVSTKLRKKLRRSL